jgi:hypothetical protein
MRFFTWGINGIGFGMRILVLLLILVLVAVVIVAIVIGVRALIKGTQATSSASSPQVQSSPQRFCAQCGAPHALEAKYCGKCGKVI